MDIHLLINYLVPVIAYVIGGTTLGAFAATFLPKIANAKYYKIAMQVLPIVNSILADNTKAYGASGVRTIVEEVIKSVDDQHLSPAEISKVLNMVVTLFNPVKAASAPPVPEAEKVLDAIAHTSSILNLDLSNIKLR